VPRPPPIDPTAAALSAPESFEQLRARVLERHGHLPRRLGQIARFAIDHPDEMAFGTIAEIARQAEVQPSALIRFSQSFGYAGFSDLQQIFRHRLRDRWPDYKERLAALRQGGAGREGPAGLLDGFADASAQSLARLREGIDTDALIRAVAILAKADTICLLGQRRAFAVSSYLAYALGQLGLRAILLDNVGSLMPEQAGAVGPQDALLVISFTPYTPGTIETAAALARRGVPVVAITDSAFSPLTPFASVWLEVAEADCGAFRSLAASLALAMTLAVATAKARGG